MNAAIRSTLRNPRRFWRCDVSIEDVMSIINAEQEDTIGYVSSVQRMNDGINEIFNSIFNEDEFAKKVYKLSVSQINAAEWETLLVHILKVLFPAYDVVHVGGVDEINHGADILIYLPGLQNIKEYVIAIQVKDYQGSTDGHAIQQICKADNYNFEGAKLVDKVVIYTGITRNDELIKIGKENNVKILFEDDVMRILARAGIKIIGKSLSRDSGLL